MYLFHKRTWLWKRHQTKGTKKQSSYPTYETGSFVDNHEARKFMENLNCTPKRFQDLVVTSSEFAEGMRLLLENLSDGINRIAALKSDSERMSNKVYPRLLFILVQSRLKK